MRKTACLMLAVLLVAVAAAQDFGAEMHRQSRAGVYWGEAGGALLGGVLVGTGATVVLGFAGAVVGIAVSPPYSEWGGFGGAIIGGAAGAAVGYPLGCGMGTTLAGQALRADGNAGAAYAGAYTGLLVGACLVGIGAAAQEPAAEVPLVAAGVLSPPIGAVIGYNMGDPDSFGARLAPPTLAYHNRHGPERQKYSVFDCRLVTVRF